MKTPLIATTVLLAGLVSGGAHAATITYTAFLSGPAESPPNASTGTGFATVVYDDTAHTLKVDATFANLIGNTTASHIHCCTATAGTGNAGVTTQVPSFSGFPLGVKSGVYDSPLFDLTAASSWNAAFITANGGTPGSAETAFAAGLASGKAYLNIHSSSFGGGEIRGFLTPEPSSWLLLGTGIVGLVRRCRRDRRG